MALMFIPFIVWFAVVNADDPLTERFEEKLNELWRR